MAGKIRERSIQSRKADIKRYGDLVTVARMKMPRDPRTIAAVNEYAAIVNGMCAYCAYRISEDDLVEIVAGQRYHQGCEPR